MRCSILAWAPHWAAPHLPRPRLLASSSSQEGGRTRPGLEVSLGIAQGLPCRDRQPLEGRAGHPHLEL